MRRCKYCLKFKPLSVFYFPSDSKSKRNFKHKCKSCLRKYTKNYCSNPDTIIHRKLYESQPEVMMRRKETSKQWRNTPKGQQCVERNLENYKNLPGKLEHIKKYDREYNLRHDVISRKKLLRSTQQYINKAKEYRARPENKVKAALYYSNYIKDPKIPIRGGNIGSDAFKESKTTQIDTQNISNTLALKCRNTKL